MARALDAVRPLGFAFAALPMTFDAGTERERHVQRVRKLEGAHHLVLDLLLADRPPVVPEPFAQAVARRLAELRALCELADYLHQARPGHRERR